MVRENESWNCSASGKTQPTTALYQRRQYHVRSLWGAITGSLPPRTDMALLITSNLLLIQSCFVKVKRSMIYISNYFCQDMPLSELFISFFFFRPSQKLLVYLKRHQKKEVCLLSAVYASKTSDFQQLADSTSCATRAAVHLPARSVAPNSHGKPIPNATWKSTWELTHTDAKSVETPLWASLS